MDEKLNRLSQDAAAILSSNEVILRSSLFFQ
jgi:hypothetical protein